MKTSLTVMLALGAVAALGLSACKKADNTAAESSAAAAESSAAAAASSAGSAAASSAP